MFGLDEDYGLLSPIPGSFKRTSSVAALRGTNPLANPSTQADDQITKFQGQADQYQQQATDLMNQPPDVSGYQKYAKQRGEQGQQALVMALAAQRAGQGFEPVQAQFLKQAAAANQPIEAGKAGMITPQGDFAADPTYGREQRIKLLTDTATKYDQLAQRATDAEMRRYAAEQSQLLRAQIAQDSQHLRLDIANQSNQTRRDVAGIGAGGAGTGGPLPDPGAEAMAQAIARYDMAAPSANLRNPRMAGVMGRVAELNPAYSATEFPMRSKVRSAFATGQEGKSVRSFGVLQDHLGTLNDAIDAMGNGNSQLLNTARNTISKWTGGTAPTNFEGIKNIVADELTKAILGSAGALGDRESMSASLKSANSPQQLKQMIARYQEMARAQLGGLRRQYETSGFQDWDQRFGNETHSAGGGAPAPDQGWSVVR